MQLGNLFYFVGSTRSVKKTSRGLGMLPHRDPQSSLSQFFYASSVGPFIRAPEKQVLRSVVSGSSTGNVSSMPPVGNIIHYSIWSWLVLEASKTFFNLRPSFTCLGEIRIAGFCEEKKLSKFLKNQLLLPQSSRNLEKTTVFPEST